MPYSLSGKFSDFMYLQYVRLLLFKIFLYSFCYALLNSAALHSFFPSFIVNTDIQTWSSSFLSPPVRSANKRDCYFSDDINNTRQWQKPLNDKNNKGVKLNATIFLKNKASSNECVGTVYISVFTLAKYFHILIPRLLFSDRKEVSLMAYIVWHFLLLYVA